MPITMLSKCTKFIFFNSSLSCIHLKWTAKNYKNSSQNVKTVNVDKFPQFVIGQKYNNEAENRNERKKNFFCSVDWSPANTWYELAYTKCKKKMPLSWFIYVPTLCDSSCIRIFNSVRNDWNKKKSNGK